MEAVLYMLALNVRLEDGYALNQDTRVVTCCAKSPEAFNCGTKIFNRTYFICHFLFYKLEWQQEQVKLLFKALVNGHYFHDGKKHTSYQVRLLFTKLPPPHTEHRTDVPQIHNCSSWILKQNMEITSLQSTFHHWLPDVNKWNRWCNSYFSGWGRLWSVLGNMTESSEWFTTMISASNRIRYMLL